MNYTFWLSLYVWFPLAILWMVNWSYLRQYKKTVLFCILMALLFSIPWDIVAVRSNIWYFPDEGNLGFWIGGLPVEEFLFMIFVTLLVSTMALLLRKRIRTKDTI